MDIPASKKFSPNFVLAAVLSGGLTVGVSLIYILLSITFLVFRTNCSAGDPDSASGAEYFWLTLFRVYVLSSSCDLEKLEIENLVDENTLLILVSVTLATSVCCLVTAVTLITIIQDEGQSRHIKLVVFSFVGCCVASLVVDLTTTTYFGIDYSYLTSLLRQLTAGSPSNYRTEVLRQGAFLFMTIAMKGYLAPVINCIFLVLLVVYVMEHEAKSVKSEEHSIHKLGALNAFGQRRQPDDAWTRDRDYYNNSPFSRGPHLNSAFEDDTPPRSPRRPEPSRSDYTSNRSFDRSDSWHHTQPHHLNVPQSSRPFSYLEDIKRPEPSQPPPSPAVQAPWARRDPWANHTPPVPAPDYSPPQPRRLKSALKSGYM